jgi:hypothetical protein
MARCEQCGNDYDKSLRSHYGWAYHGVRQFRMRNSSSRAHLPSLRVPRHWAWGGAQWKHLLLRPLRQSGGRNQSPRPRLNCKSRPALSCSRRWRTQNFPTTEVAHVPFRSPSHRRRAPRGNPAVNQTLATTLVRQPPFTSPRPD